MTTESRIQIDKLDNQNWGIWRRKFKALLLSKRLGGVIDGTDEDKDNSSQVLGLIQLHLVPLGFKSEAAQAIRATIRLCEAQTGHRLKAVRTDRDIEYVNSELETYFSDKGVIHNTTAPYTPEQNGVPERFNRTLMERVRAMLFDANLGYEHWVVAASTATYVKNRSPSSHSSQTPWELFFGRKPDVSGMQVFGSKAYMHVCTKQQTNTVVCTRTPHCTPNEDLLFIQVCSEPAPMHCSKVQG